MFVYSDPVGSPSFGGLVGGFGAWQDSTDEIQSISDELRNEVETRMNSPAFIKYEAVKYQTQVVAGTNYKIRIDVGGESGVEITVYKTLPLPQSTLSLVKAEWVNKGKININDILHNKQCFNLLADLHFGRFSFL